jgi:CorA-like Mg2+ transporter protein
MMEPLHTWQRLPSFTSAGLTGLTVDALWKQLLSSGTGETPAQRAGHCFQEHQWVHINHAGVSNTIKIDRHYLVRALRLRYRDLAAIDPTLPLPAPSVLLVRARAIAINLDVGGAIRIIICENQVYVLSLPKPSDPAVTALPTEDHPFVKRLCACLKNSTSSSVSVGKLVDTDSDYFEGLNGGGDNGDNNISKNGTTTTTEFPAPSTPVSLSQGHHHHHHHQGFDIDMPYELRALEVALTAALGILTAEIDELEEWGYPAVDCLLRQVDRDTLENVRRLKNSIDKLKAKVQRIVTEIGDWMEDDDDMADLYLGRRAEAQGLLPLPQPGEERDLVDDEIERALPKRSGTFSSIEEPNVRDTNKDDGNDSGIEHDDDFEQEIREKEAEDALEDRQRARRVRNRNRNRVDRQIQEAEESQERSNRGRIRRHLGGNGDNDGLNNNRNGNNNRNRKNNGDDDINDDTQSIGDNSMADSLDLEDEALSKAEEAFLLRQGSLNAYRSGGAGGGGGGSLYGGTLAPRVDPHEIEEAEDLLETMYERADMLLRRLSILDERCEDTEALLELDLDQKRNQLVGLNVVVSSMSMSFGFAAAIGGIFGMNLKNEDLAEEAWVLALVLALMLLGSVALIVVVGWYMHKKKLMFIPTTV